MADPDSAETSFPLVEDVVARVKRARILAKGAPITALLCALMIGLFIGVRASHDSAAALSRFGYRSAFDVWSGSVWAMLTTNFVHESYWHVGLNTFWIWRLGTVVEPVIGWIRMLLFIVAASIVASALQLAIFESTGFGASGIAYAIFGLGWVASRKHASLRPAFRWQTVFMWMAWLIVCFAVFYREIGNGAHLGGFAFGVAAGAALITERRRWVPRAVLASTLVLSTAVAFVCPWSPFWWATMGYRAHAHGDVGLAASAYRLSLKMRPAEPWVVRNLAIIEGDAGADDAATDAAP